MATVTISLPTTIAKKVDAKAQKKGFATRSEFIRSLLRNYFASQVTENFTFQEFQPKPLKQMRAELEKTGKYNKKYIDEVIKGLSESSAYANKTSH